MSVLDGGRESELGPVQPVDGGGHVRAQKDHGEDVAHAVEVSIGAACAYFGGDSCGGRGKPLLMTEFENTWVVLRIVGEWNDRRECCEDE